MMSEAQASTAEPTLPVSAIVPNLVPLPPNLHSWDPSSLAHVQPTTQSLIRIKRDIMSIYKDPPQGIFVVPDEQNLSLVHALIVGISGTPYEGGFFYFLVRFPPTYPIDAPKVRLMTTGAGTVRFNPNLYANGKVCLSILGTWSGPAWSPAQCLESLLVSIQSLLCENPYHNEPGFEKEHNKGDVARYNDIIRHETLRVAIIGMVENECYLQMPQPLKDVMEKAFLSYYDSYVAVAEANTCKTNLPMVDPFGDQRGTFVYNLLAQRLPLIKEKLKAKWGDEVLVASQPVPEADDANDSDMLEFSDLEDGLNDDI